MKHFLALILVVALALSLAACGDNNHAVLPSIPSDGSDVLETDFQKNMNQSTSTNIYCLCKTTDGYYFQFDCILYFIDRETGDSTILCGKPDCNHVISEFNKSCNAYVYTNLLSYYNGKIYYTNSDAVLENGNYVRKGERLFSMNLDGTEHDAVQSLDFIPDGDTNNFITEPIIHRGYVYFSYSGALYTAKLGADIENATLIYGKQKTDDGSHVVDSKEQYYELWADGDLVYFMVKNIQQGNGTYKDTLFCYDPQSNQSKQIWQVPEKSEVGTWDTTGVSVSQWYISDGYIYFYLCGNDIWCTELSTEKTTKLIDLDLEAGVAAFSDKYITVINKQYNDFISFTGESGIAGGDYLYIYDYNGKLIQEISLGQIYQDHKTAFACHIAFCDAGKVYVYVDATVSGIYSAAYSSNTVQEHYLYAVDIASGTLGDVVWSYYKEY